MADDATVDTDAVTITVDGRQVEARRGEMLISAAERAGTYIPRFCYHPRMRPVGMCRMCLVEVKGPRGYSLTPACFVPVAEGQDVVTDSPKVKKAQDGVLEFLLINHPLDCPVCDKGGECPLQDQTLAFGPGESRFVEEKRHWEKPIALSSLVSIDRERCIQCDRCTRFADEVAGDPLIEFVGRGDHTEINTFPDQPFSSYFSGNTVQICPVGALLAKPYRFKARPWDLEQVETTCTSCALGCRCVVQSTGTVLTRFLGIDSDPVNHGWMCDKGRFDFEAINSGERLVAPMVRKGDELVEVSWGEALDAAASGLAKAREVHGPSSLALLGGARLANEDAYAWAKLAKGVLGTDNVDCQLGDGLPAEVVLGLPRATIDEACRADTVILLTGDVKEELPVLYLRLREAALSGRTSLVELSPRSTGLTRYAAASLGYRPGEVVALADALARGGATGEVAGVAAADVEVAHGLLGDDIVVVLGRPSLAESAVSIVAAAAVLARIPGVRFLSGLRRGNVHGALDMGLAPGVLPGRVGLDEGRQWFGDAWGVVPDQRGDDATGILAAAAAGRLQGLVLLGADPACDFPDADLAGKALAGAGFVVAVDTFMTDSAGQADVVLPAATFAERPGTTTNIEGRLTRLGQKITPPGQAWADWMIAAELAWRLGGELGFDSLDDIAAEIERLAPSHAGITRRLLADGRWRDGVVAPLTGTPVQIGSGSGRRPLDPMATPGIGAAERQGVPSGAMAGDDQPDAADVADPTTGDGQADAAEGAAGATEGATDASEGTADDEDIAGPTAAPPAAPSAPAMLRFSGEDATIELPKRDAYSMRLVVTRALYDLGTSVQRSPSLAGLANAGSLAANPTDLERLGLADGGQVRLKHPRATVLFDAVPDAGVPRGSVAMRFNQPGDPVQRLIDATTTVTDVRVETV